MIRASYALKCQGILAHGRAERFGGFVREDAVFAGPAEAVDGEVDARCDPTGVCFDDRCPQRKQARTPLN